MANYEGWARTNYFRVKDEAEFRKELETLTDLELVESNGSFSLFSTAECGWDVRDAEAEDEDGDCPEIDFPAWLAHHLADGEVAVGISAGHEKLRCVSGHAWAVDHTGKVVQVGTWDIYELAAKEFPGASITPAEY